MSELVEYRMHQQIAQEIYRQQMMRLPDPYPSMLPVPPPRHHMHHHHHQFSAAYTLTGIEAKLQNFDLWNSFAPHGTEMIITKSGRRMFPSVRVNLSGLEEDASYCLMLEMVPIGDCRYKFSGSQWVPAGGAEPQSPQRMYLHPDSPALGSHWNSQPISFSKVKLTNNTLDSSGHVVLTSMHKYRPRLHVIRTSEPSQIPWSPSQVFFFPDTDFVAVTAYQNDQITKLKIDNNPFAKGFRETGQSRCKRKHIQSSANHNGTANHSGSSPSKLPQLLPPSRVISSDAGSSSSSSSSHQNTASNKTTASATATLDGQPMKRRRTNSTGSVSSLDDSGLSICGSSSRTSSPNAEEINRTGTLGVAVHHLGMENGLARNSSLGLPPLPTGYLPQQHQPSVESLLHYQQQLQQHLMNMQSLAHQSEPIRPSWLDFALYFSRNNGGGAAPTLTTPMLSPSPLQQHHPHHQHHQHQLATHSFHGSAFELHSPAISPVACNVNQEEKSSSISSPNANKCRSFTIDAILGK